MFLGQPNPTPFDVKFRLLGTPVRVHPLFWLVGGIFGYMYLQYRGQLQGKELDQGFLALWLAWMFVSILVHEFGHITMARLSGRRGQVILHSFGGLAVWDAPADRRWQRIAIAAAGPGAGFLFFALVLLIKDLVSPHIGLQALLERPTLVTTIVESLAMLSLMNLFWNLLNLIPIWPLDGGQITLEVLSGLAPRHGYRLAFGMSFLLAGSVAGYALMALWQGWILPYHLHPGFTALFVGLMAWQNLQVLLATEHGRRRFQNALDQDAE